MNLPCLDIIIPQYKEPEEMLFKLLTSINNQVGINLAKVIRVTIINDCNDEGYDILLGLNKYNFNFSLSFLQTPVNGGAGRARQYGLDHTELPYVMFMDADDCLWDCGALMKLINSIRVLEVQNKPWSYIWSDFYEEKFTGEKGYDLLLHNQPSMIWMHGKVWNRQFLKDNNISFHPTLRTFEDTYFGKIVALSAPKTYAYHCTDVTYLWKRNPNSVTAGWNHDNRSYLYWNYKDYMTCTYGVLEFLYPNYKKCARWNELFFSSLYFTYFLLQMTEYSDLDNPETLQKRKDLVDLFISLIVDFGDTVEDLSTEQKAFWYGEVRKDVYGTYCGFTFEHQNYNDFLSEIGYGDLFHKFKLDWKLMKNS